MTTTSAGPPSLPPAATRWLWVVRILAGMSIFLIVLLIWWVWTASGGTPPMPFPASTSKGVHLCTLGLVALMPVPYLLILVLLRGKSEQKGLALAAMTGCGGAIGAFMGFGSSPAASLVLLVSQILLLVGAYRAHAAKRRWIGDPRKLEQVAPRWSYLGLFVFPGFFWLFVSEGMIAHSVPRYQAWALRSLHMINTAEVTMPRNTAARSAPV